MSLIAEHTQYIFAMNSDDMQNADKQRETVSKTTDKPRKKGIAQKVRKTSGVSKTKAAKATNKQKLGSLKYSSMTEEMLEEEIAVAGSSASATAAGEEGKQVGDEDEATKAESGDEDGGAPEAGSSVYDRRRSATKKGKKPRLTNPFIAR